MKSHALNRTIVMVLCICMLVPAAITATSAQIGMTEIPEYAEIEAIEGATYGHAYDSRLRRVIRAHGGCVEYTNRRVEGGGADHTSSFQSYKSNSDLMRETGRSTRASLSAGLFGFGGSASYSSSVLNRISASRFTESVIAHSPIVDNFKYLDLNGLKLKSEYIEMLRDPTRRGEFRESCGDSFIWGIQQGREFFGTAHITGQSMETWARFAGEMSASASGWTVSAAVAREWARKMEQSFGSSGIDVKAESTGASRNPTSLNELVQLFKGFPEQATTRTPLRMAVAPYSYAEGYPLEDPLMPNPQDAALGVLADSVWELRGMVDDAALVVGQPRMFALGTGAKRTVRLRFVRQAGERWKEELRRLRQQAAPCLEEFTRACETLAQQYGRTLPKLRADREDLPKRYGSDCSQTISLVNDDGSLKYVLDMGGPLSHIKGDMEMGGGPGRFDAWAKISRDARKLKMQLYTSLAEWKLDPFGSGRRWTSDGRDTEFVLDLTRTIVDLDDTPRLNGEGAIGNLSECEFASNPIDHKLILIPIAFHTPSHAHGHIVRTTPKNPSQEIHKWQGSATGILRAISCQADGPGRDVNLRCEAPEFTPFAMRLINRLDRQADAWEPGRPVAKPRLVAPVQSALDKLPGSARTILIQRHDKTSKSR